MRGKAMLLGFATGMAMLLPVARAGAQVATGSNVVVIVTDDQRWDELENMPNVRSLLQQHGVTYTNGFEPNSLCCPGRSAILTGQYPSTTGVWNNASPHGGFSAFKPHEAQTLATWLHGAGYYTGLVGKYFNQFSVSGAKSTSNPTGLDARPGWDYFTAFINPSTGGSEPPAYYGYSLDVRAEQNTPGTLTSFGTQTNPTPACATYGVTSWAPGGTCYSTTVLGNDAVNFIDTAPATQPFFLDFTPYGPHAPFTPAPPDSNSLPNCTGGQTPETTAGGCYQPMTVSSACPPQNGLPPYCSENIGKVGTNEVSWVKALSKTGTGFNTGNRKSQERTLIEVDRQVGDIISAVETRDPTLSNTVFIFTTDNSLSGGSHRWTAKETGWDEALHLPFIVRYDPLTAALAGTTDSRFVLDSDIAPTVLALCGPTCQAQVPQDYAFDGQEIPPFNDSFSRSEFPLEHLALGTANPPTYCGVRTTPGYSENGVTGQWAYLRYQNFSNKGYPPYEEELYNIDADPWELANLATDPSYATTLATLKGDAEALCSPAPPSGFTWTG